QYEEVRDAWQTVRAKVAVRAANVDYNSGKRECNRRNVAARRRQRLNLLFIKGGGQCNVLRIHQGKRGSADLNDGLVSRRGHLNIDRNGGAYQNRHNRSL